MSYYDVFPELFPLHIVYTQRMILKRLSRDVNVNLSELICTLFNDAASNSEDVQLNEYISTNK